MIERRFYYILFIIITEWKRKNTTIYLFDLQMVTYRKSSIGLLIFNNAFQLQFCGFLVALSIIFNIFQAFKPSTSCLAAAPVCCFTMVSSITCIISIKVTNSVGLAPLTPTKAATLESLL